MPSNDPRYSPPPWPPAGEALIAFPTHRVVAPRIEEALAALCPQFGR
jgi:hypothetical protein